MIFGMPIRCYVTVTRLNLVKVMMVVVIGIMAWFEIILDLFVVDGVNCDINRSVLMMKRRMCFEKNHCGLYIVYDGIDVWGGLHNGRIVSFSSFYSNIF